MTTLNEYTANMVELHKEGVQYYNDVLRYVKHSKRKERAKKKLQWHEEMLYFHDVKVPILRQEAAKKHDMIMETYYEDLGY